MNGEAPKAHKFWFPMCIRNVGSWFEAGRREVDELGRDPRHELAVATHRGFEQMFYQFEDQDGTSRESEG